MTPWKRVTTHQIWIASAHLIRNTELKVSPYTLFNDRCYSVPLTCSLILGPPKRRYDNSNRSRDDIQENFLGVQDLQQKRHHPSMKELSYIEQYLMGFENISKCREDTFRLRENTIRDREKALDIRDVELREREQKLTSTTQRLMEEHLRTIQDLHVNVDKRFHEQTRRADKLDEEAEKRFQERTRRADRLDEEAEKDFQQRVMRAEKIRKEDELQLQEYMMRTKERLRRRYEELDRETKEVDEMRERYIVLSRKKHSNSIPHSPQSPH